MNKSKAENTDLNTLADNVYKEFIRNECYCGLNSIFKDKKIASKTDIALKNGYRIETVWQYDWETVEDKIQLINKILNG
jgi:CRISPR/Cas system CMR-associated protein Cmr3 (group 5 of RAMP superfamily)